jgi:cytoplasmic tRNA 2-thiolation protein 1
LFSGHARTFLKDLEAINPSAILDIIHSGEAYQSDETSSKSNNSSVSRKVTLGTCERCGYMASNALCKACVMLEGLNRGLPKLAVGSNQMQRTLLEVGKKEGGTQVEIMQNFKELAVSKTLKGPSLDF